jgi:2-polyprenyl-3-methyl-5-hydroxy-6-metoxy-1,4-benzoquinol methylase
VKLTGNIERDGKEYDIYLCKKCLIGVLSPMPSIEALKSLYSSESYRATSGVKFNEFFEQLIYLFRIRRKRRIKEYIKRGRILDIGCGRGLFLNIMRKDGWDVMGAEFDEEIASNAFKAYGVSVKTGNPSEWGLSDESFDVITINHALEHIKNPVEILNASKRLLRKGGLLVIATPNISSLQAAAGKKVWFHLDIPYHLYHFSEEGLVRLLQKNSFNISRIRRFDLEYNPFGWLQTLLNLSGIRENFFYNLLKNPELRNREFVKTNIPYLMLTVILLPIYFPLSFLLSVFESLMLKRGGTVDIFAVKQ